MNTVDLRNKGLESVPDLPNNVQDLYLCDNQITRIDNIIWPNNLRGLCLCHNQIKSLDNVSFPKSLQALSLANNKITKIGNVFWTTSLETIHLDNNLLPSHLYKLSTKKLVEKSRLCFTCRQIWKYVLPRDIIDIICDYLF